VELSIERLLADNRHLSREQVPTGGSRPGQSQLSQELLSASVIVDGRPTFNEIEVRGRSTIYHRFELEYRICGACLDP
jgi:hypothetical protein